MLLNNLKRISTYTYNRLLGDLFLRVNKPAKAAIFTEKALHLSLHTNKGRLYYILGKTYEEANEHHKAIKVFQDAVDMDSNNLDYRWRLGILLLSRGYYEHAFPQLQFIVNELRKTPNDKRLANSSAVLAQCCLPLQKFEFAEELLQYATTMLPWDLDACKGTIDLYNVTGRFNQILPLIERYIQKYPHMYPAHIWKANHIHYYLYNPRDSLDEYTTALNQINESKIRKYCEGLFSSHQIIAQLFNDYIGALIASNEPNKAFLFAKGSQVRRFRGEWLYEHLIQYYIATENYKEAEELCSKAIKTKKESPEFWSLLALTQACQNKFDSAFQNIDHAIFLDSDHTSSLDVLGIIQVKKQMWNSAILTYEKIVQYAPLSPDWIKDLAYCYTMVERFEDARIQCEKVVALDPHNANAWVDLGLIYFHLNRFNDAQLACEHGLEYEYLDLEKKQNAIRVLKDIKLI
jgi:tetratricopeptide (TPR) repeat protein